MKCTLAADVETHDTIQEKTWSANNVDTVTWKNAMKRRNTKKMMTSTTTFFYGSTGLTVEEINYWLMELQFDQEANDIYGEDMSNYYEMIL